MNELGTCIFLKVHVPILLVNNHSHGLSRFLINNMAFKFSPENFEIVHIFYCILGITMPCELNYGMTLVTSRARVLRELNTLNVTEWAEPLQRLVIRTNHLLVLCRPQIPDSAPQRGHLHRFCYCSLFSSQWGGSCSRCLHPQHPRDRLPFCI